MKSITRYFQGLKMVQPKCNPQPGHWNSCEPCKGCTKRAKFPDGGGPGPSPWGSELREDGSNELREDGGIELREN